MEKAMNRYYAIDIDKMCVNMTAINMTLHGMFGAVIYGNTLSTETWGGYEIKLKRGIPCIKPLSAEAAKEFIIQNSDKLKTPADHEKGQLQLF